MRWYTRWLHEPTRCDDCTHGAARSHRESGLTDRRSRHRVTNAGKLCTAALRSTKQSETGAGGRPPKLSPAAIERFRTLVLEHPTASIDDLCVLVNQQLGVQLCQLSMYRYLKRVGIQRRKTIVDVISGIPKQDRVVPTETPNRFLETPKARYGYAESHCDDGDVTRYPGALTDAEWALVSNLFEHDGPGKPPKYPRRKLLDACCYAVRTECSWRMLPKDLPPWQDVYAHFRRWTAKNLFETMHDRLRAMWRRREGRDAAPTAAVIDSQSVKTSAQGGPKGFDAGKKVKGRKRHLVVDVLGLLLAVLVHPANSVCCGCPLHVLSESWGLHSMGREFFPC